MTVMYGRFQIKTFKSGKGWKAQAWRKNIPAGPVEIADDYDSAVLAAKSGLDIKLATQIVERGTDGYPTIEEVRQALEVVARSDGQQKMLMAHLKAPGHILTATELSQAAAYINYAAANMHYGALGKAVSEELNWVTDVMDKGIPVWTFTLATNADEGVDLSNASNTREFRWRLRPQIVAALTA